MKEAPALDCYCYDRIDKPLVPLLGPPAPPALPLALPPSIRNSKIEEGGGAGVERQDLGGGGGGDGDGGGVRGTGDAKDAGGRRGTRADGADRAYPSHSSGSVGPSRSESVCPSLYLNRSVSVCLSQSQSADPSQSPVCALAPLAARGHGIVRGTRGRGGGGGSGGGCTRGAGERVDRRRRG